MQNQLINLEAIVLAGGKGERMGSDKSKVLHEINGKPMIFYTLEKLVELGIKNIIVVIGYQAEAVKQNISQGCRSINSFESEPEGSSLRVEDLGGCRLKFAYQQELLGTADAVKVALDKLDPSTQRVLVVNGDDSAFYSIETLEDFLASHMSSGNSISAITTFKPQVEIGRVIRDKNGNFEKILEFDEYQKSGLSSDEINCGAYLFEVKWLRENLNKVKLSPNGEYYLTDLLNIAKKKGEKITLYKLKNPDEWQGINTQEDLEEANLLFERSEKLP